MVGWINSQSLASGPWCVQWIQYFSLRESKAAAICLSLPGHSCCKIVVPLIHCVKMKTKCLHNNSELGIVVWGWTLCSQNNDLFEFSEASALTFSMSQTIIFLFLFWWSVCAWEVILIKIYVVSNPLLLYCCFVGAFVLLLYSRSKREWPHASIKNKSISTACLWSAIL